MIQTLYDFTWHEFCDWYLELTKAVLTAPDADPALKRGAQTTLVDVLTALLKLLHPLMPFVTEELWLTIAKQRGISSPTLMLERFPEAADFATDGRRAAERPNVSVQSRHAYSLKTPGKPPEPQGPTKKK